ncbi:MAG: RNA polymerase sigma-70 factor (ECF subfamily) [Pseudohongiellaceae bacterium]|jgi:RNA polymerase sigma-70 factor (ECF subfamily)
MVPEAFQPSAAFVEQLYDELHRLAARAMGRERVGHTLQPTALINEAWLRLADQKRGDWESPSHYKALAATMMRRVLVDHARRGHAEKRGGGERPVTLHTEAPLADDDKALDLAALDDALTDLAALSPRQAKVVELRYFGGLTAPEAAQVLDVSERTLHREWSLARAWLRRALSDD